MPRHRPLRGVLALALGLSTLGATLGQGIFSTGSVSSIPTGADGLPSRMAGGLGRLGDTQPASLFGSLKVDGGCSTATGREIAQWGSGAPSDAPRKEFQET